MGSGVGEDGKHWKQNNRRNGQQDTQSKEKKGKSNLENW